MSTTSLDKPSTPARIGFRHPGRVRCARLLHALSLDPGGRRARSRSVERARQRRPQGDACRSCPGDIPPLAQLGIEVAGTLTDIGADKLPGREKIEGGQFTLQQEGGALAVKGEAKLSGSPATFDLRVPKAGTGELIVTTMLDEAARARRSLPVAPALSGPVGVKVAVPLGAKIVPRVEADLVRAVIDGLVPGWQKPAGQARTCRFTWSDGTTTELRDLTVDAGPVQMKGSVVLSSAGALERADFSTLRLSPGDDMRAQLDRAGSGYRVAIRGNNADARPFLKWLERAAGQGRPPTRATTSTSISRSRSSAASTTRR